MEDILKSIPWALFLTRYVVMLAAFTVHELGHALTAAAFGDPTPRSEGRLTLNPFRHVEYIGGILAVMLGFGWSRPVHIQTHKMRVPDPLGGVIAVLAGPLANLLMVGIGVAAMRALSLWPSLPYSTWPDAAQWLTVFVRLNLAIALLNVLPLFPLDGYWLVHAVLPLPALAWWEGAAGRTTLVLGIGIAAMLMMPAAWLSAIYLPVVLTVSRVVLGW